MYYLNTFFIYSMIGHLLEITVQSIITKNPTSGILFGPWTPIYGLGAIIIMITYEKIIKNMHKSKFIEIITAFIITSILLSLIELIGGILIEKIFGIVFWDYTNHQFNIGKYTSLEMTLTWGITSLIFYYILYPLINKIIIKTPKIITYILSILFVTDMIYTIISKIY